MKITENVGAAALCSLALILSACGGTAGRTPAANENIQACAQAADPSDFASLVQQRQLAIFCKADTASTPLVGQIAPIDQVLSPDRTFAPQQLRPRLSAQATNLDAPLVNVLWEATPLSPNARINFTGEKLDRPEMALLQPLIASIYADYGSPITEIGKVRALRDWVARTAIHPYSYFHYGTPNKNLANLPDGMNWIPIVDLPLERATADTAYWWNTYKLDGFRILDKLIGLTGDEGAPMMNHVSGSLYKMKSLDSYRFVLCTYQASIFFALANAAGYQGLLTSTVGHDTGAIYIPAYRNWVFMDPTYNEEYARIKDGAPATPYDLLQASVEGVALTTLKAVKFKGPSWDPATYLNFGDTVNTTYFADGHPGGMIVMGSQLQGQLIKNPTYASRLTQIMTPVLPTYAIFNDERVYTRVFFDRAYPKLGLYLGSLNYDSAARTYTVNVQANIDITSWEYKAEGGNWVIGQNPLILPAGAGKVLMRGYNTAGLATSVSEYVFP